MTGCSPARHVTPFPFCFHCPIACRLRHVNRFAGRSFALIRDSPQGHLIRSRKPSQSQHDNVVNTDLVRFFGFSKQTARLGSGVGTCLALFAVMFCEFQIAQQAAAKRRQDLSLSVSRNGMLCKQLLLSLLIPCGAHAVQPFDCCHVTVFHL